MAVSKGPVVLLLAAILLALVVGIALWTTASPDAPVAEAPAPPAPHHAPVTGTVGLESAGADEPSTRALEPVAELEDEGTPPGATATPAQATLSATALGGVVRRRAGGPASEGTFVLARTTPNPHTDADLVERFLRRDPDVPVARTARDGSFRIEKLEPGTQYQVSAVGDGCVSVEPPVAALSGTPDVRIDVCLLYGIAIELREEGGRDLRSSIQVLDLNLSRTAYSTPFADTPLLALLGVDLAPYRSGWNRRLLLFTSSRLEEPPVLDRIPVRIRIAGYTPAQPMFDAQPVLPVLTVHAVELHPSAAGFGEILLRFSDGDDPTVDAPKTKRWRLVLASTTGIQAEVELPGDRGVKRLVGIPHGRYRMSVVNCLDQEIYPPRTGKEGEPSRPLEVGDRPLALDISLAETSTLEIAIATPGGAAYQGPATFSLARGEPAPDRRSLVGPTATVTFDRAPYVVAGIRSGHYMVFVPEPAGVALDPPGSPGVLELQAGRRTSVRLLMP